MSIQTRLVEYSDGKITYEGMLAWNDATGGSKPGVLVAHTVRGRTPFEESRARALAELGYAAFALDVYGKSEFCSDDANTRAQMEALKADRKQLQRRLSLSLSVMRGQPEIIGTQVAAIGFCFGGLCALDLARMGERLAGVVSFHGLFEPPGNTSANTVVASILALHGWDDPLATPEAVAALAAELTDFGADWQIHAYGNTSHAFTNPAANDTERGTVYDAVADQRSWTAMQTISPKNSNDSSWSVLRENQNDCISVYGWQPDCRLRQTRYDCDA